MPRYIVQNGTSVRSFATWDEAATWLEKQPEARDYAEIRAVYAPGEAGEPDWNNTSDPRVPQAERDEHESENF